LIIISLFDANIISGITCQSHFINFFYLLEFLEFLCRLIIL